MTAFIAFQNLSDAATLSAESARPSLAVSNLQNEHVATPWRSYNMPTWVATDLGGSQAINVVALFGTNGLATTDVRVRIGDDPSFATSAYDSGWLSGRIDPAFRSFVHILGYDVTGRYVRVDVMDAALGWFDAGRQFIGWGYRPVINFSWGSARGYRDPSVRSQSLGGQTFSDRRPKIRRMSLTFGALDNNEAQGFFEDLDRINGTTVDILLCRREQSDNLGRDTIFGLLTSLADTVASAFDINSKPFSIEERK